MVRGYHGLQWPRDQFTPIVDVDHEALLRARKEYEAACDAFASAREKYERVVAEEHVASVERSRQLSPNRPHKPAVCSATTDTEDVAGGALAFFTVVIATATLAIVIFNLFFR